MQETSTTSTELTANDAESTVRRWSPRNLCAAHCHVSNTFLFHRYHGFYLHQTLPMWYNVLKIIIITQLRDNSLEILTNYLEISREFFFAWHKWATGWKMVFLQVAYGPVGTGIQAHLYSGVNALSCFYLWYPPGRHRARYRPSYQDLQQTTSILVKHDIDLRWFAVICGV